MTSRGTRPTEILVDLGAYRDNLALVQKIVAPAIVMAVVKADAYGHGLVPIAKTAVSCEVQWLGTLDTGTALQLREAGIGAGVSVFAWHLAPNEDYRAIIDASIDLGISTVDQLEHIASARAGRAARLHLKIDTGLHRNGALAADWPELVARAIELERAGLVEIYGVWTHISEASYEEDSAAIRRFKHAIVVAEALGARFTVRHLAASAAGFAREDCRFDLVRFGAFGYGISPGDGVTPSELGLTPVMSLTTTAVTASDSAVVIPVGYGDGLSSRISGRVQLLVDGILRVVDSVEIDRMTVTGTAVRPGAEVVLFGSGAMGEWTLQQWADSTGTIAEEIVTRLGKEIPRRYVGP
ncbi:MAG: alanine racemase [Lacisediminihabitans sp.]